jgi:hypothetical protein
MKSVFFFNYYFHFSNHHTKFVSNASIYNSRNFKLSLALYFVIQQEKEKKSALRIPQISRILYTFAFWK